MEISPFVGAGLRRSCLLSILQLWGQVHFLPDVFTTCSKCLLKL
jgi:hypothetical protein